jgi:hypothetical protein
MSDDRLRIAHQLRLCAIADTDPRQLRLLEIPINPEAVGIDDGDIAGAGVRIIAAH